ncbi:MAG: hypothetical protein B7Z15_17975 [Rhizobiales bacterium 32-66-8]|nr:MAG: hypothetical protein B7Z15_17975 [Rhizobiales bacterium 32-66-8]
MSDLGAPAAMEGDGAYNRNSQVQAQALRGALDLWRAAAGAVPLPSGGGPVTIADFGAAAGRNSLEPMGLAVSRLRRRLGPQVPLSIVHVDVPGNDFTALFETLRGDPQSYLAHDPLTFALAAGGSFFGPVLPPASVTLGWSSWAVHWLSRAPCGVPDHILAELSGDAAVRAAFAEQAAQDWRSFLESRAGELQAGGRLVVMTIADTGEGPAYAPILTAIRDALEDLVARGDLARAEVDAMVVPTVTRDAPAYAAPFTGPDAVPGLRLLTLEIRAGDDAIWPLYQREGDALAWAAHWVGFLRAAVFPTLALRLVDGSPERRRSFFERLEQGAIARLALRPAPMAVHFSHMMIEKDGGGAP